MPAHASRHGLLPFGNPALMTSHETFREPEAGFGPATCALRGRRSDLLSYSGDARVAAAARETVPRLGGSAENWNRHETAPKSLAPPVGFEPTAHGLENRRSIH